jgi:hypothetical protein
MTDQIDQLLSQTGMADEAQVREFLGELQHASTSVRPLPSAELSALLVMSPRRSGAHRRRLAITALIVVGALGAGATAAAASPDVRAATGQAVQAVVGAFLAGTGASSTPATTGPTATPTPGSSKAASDGHPSPTHHPDMTNHPQPNDHPGGNPSNPSDGTADTHSDSGTSHHPDAPNGQPTTPRGHSDASRGQDASATR